MLKFDLDRASPTFGEIIGSYKGTSTSTSRPARSCPATTSRATTRPTTRRGSARAATSTSTSAPRPTCSRTRRRPQARRRGPEVGRLPRVRRRRRWSRCGRRSSGRRLASAASSARPRTTARRSTARSRSPGYALVGLGRRTARTAGSAPVADGAHWGNPGRGRQRRRLHVDLTGFLDAYDARNGALLGKRPLALGGGSSPTSLSLGRREHRAQHRLRRGRHRLGLADGFIVAFRPGGTNDAVADVEKTAGDLVGGGGEDAGPAHPRARPSSPDPARPPPPTRPR